MRKKSGKAQSWILFVVLIVGAFGALWIWQKAGGPTPPSETVAPGTPATQTPGKPSKGFAKENLSEEEKAILDNDAMNRAMRSGEGCESIAFDPALRQQCLDTLNFNNAMQSNDEKVCLRIEDKAMRADCLNRVYLALATRNQDLGLCDKITDGKMKQACVDSLLAAKGRSATSAKDCDPIQDERLKQACLDDFGFSKSVKDLDVKECESIQDPELRSRCAKTVANNIKAIEIGRKAAQATPLTTTEKLRGCTSLVGDAVSRCQNQANFDLAAEKKDISYCGQIKDPKIQKNCVDTQSVAINNYYMRLATAKKDSSLCAKILDAGLRASCETYSK
jgi:hypothetical protein